MNEKGTKRKKKSFFQKTKKYYRKGVRGKGIRVDEESFEYFLHVLKIMNQNFESEEEKSDFVRNVFDQVKGNELDYSSNQVVSRIIDNLLPFASNEVVLNFIAAFDPKLRVVCTDPYASHVFQKLVTTVMERYRNNFVADTDESSNVDEEFQKWSIKVTKFCTNNFEEFIFDDYANHVLRTIVCCLIGEKETNVAKLGFQNEKKLPAEFTEILKNFIDQLLIWPRFAELPYANLLSGFLQILLNCTVKFNPKRTKLLVRKLLDCCFAPETKDKDVGTSETECSDFSILPRIFSNESCVRLLETLICVAPAKYFARIYASCFMNRLSSLACHASGNFAVQKLIQNSKEKSEFESIFDELSSSFDSILTNNRSGVILQLCEACLRLKTKQSKFTQVWMEYLGCHELKETRISLFPLTIYMKRKCDYNANDENTVSLHGSLLVQYMLKFNKPIKIVSSLLETNGNQLSNIFCDQRGSYIADAFFESEFVGEKSRDKLFRLLSNFYSSLAISKAGSRVFDILWRAANVKNRAIIGSELLEEEAKLSNSPFGRPIIYNLSLNTLRRDKEAWMKAQATGEKAKRLFADIVDS